MLDVEQSEPSEVRDGANILDFIVGEVQLDEFAAALERLHERNGIKLQLSILNIHELLNALEVCDRFESEFDLLESTRILK